MFLFTYQDKQFSCSFRGITKQLTFQLPRQKFCQNLTHSHLLGLLLWYFTLLFSLQHLILTLTIYFTLFILIHCTVYHLHMWTFLSPQKLVINNFKINITWTYPQGGLRHSNNFLWFHSLRLFCNFSLICHIMPHIWFHIYFVFSILFLFIIPGNY